MVLAKPSGYDEAEAKEYGERQELPAGGYLCRIVNAWSEKSKKSQRPMVIVQLDIASGEYTDFFAELPENLQFQARSYQLMDGEAVPYFKGFIANIEASNQDYTWDWNPQSLIGLSICGIFGREQYESKNDGSVNWSTRLVRLAGTDALFAGTIKPPKDKTLGGKPAGHGSTNNSFFEQNTGATLDDDDLPF